jgi:hypothetical protein
MRRLRICRIGLGDIPASSQLAGQQCGGFMDKPLKSVEFFWQYRARNLGLQSEIEFRISRLRALYTGGWHKTRS